MESLVQDLASSRLDAASPIKRSQVFQEAAELVKDDAEARLVVASQTGV